MATPFVQGQLRREFLSVEIDTECAHCGRPLHLTVDSDLNVRVQEREAHPLVFEPDVDWAAFRDPNIIHAY